MELRFKLVVVTGAGSGLGRVIAVRLARAGAGVLVADRDGEGAEETARLVREHRVPSWAAAVDVTHDDDLVRLAAQARDLGGADLLVNNAGGWSRGEQYPLAPPDVWGATLDLNLRAPMRLLQLFLDGLEHRRGRADEPGAVVNVSSSAALGAAGYGSPEYAATKAALVRLTTAMATTAIAERARVTCVVPGWIGLDRAQEQWDALDAHTRAGLPPLIPPAEVARVVLELLSSGEPGAVVEL